MGAVGVLAEHNRRRLKVRRGQMENMGLWLAMNDGSAVQREWAERQEHRAAGTKTKF